MEKSKPEAIDQEKNNQRLTTPVYAEYANYDARLETFTAWPIAMEQKDHQLAEAGFFYTQRGDAVTCFQCGGMINKWERTDDPWIEHAKWFTTCPFVYMCKGQTFTDMAAVYSLLQESTTKEKDTQEDTISIALPSSLTCKICYVDELDIVFLPCGHLISCGKCAAQMTDCSVCRSPIECFTKAKIPFAYKDDN